LLIKNNYEDLSSILKVVSYFITNNLSYISLLITIIMKSFIVEIVMTLKSAARDPVADTIQRDLIAKKGFDMVSHVRSGQYLKISLQAEDKDSAEQIIVRMCNILRIYNPVTQNLNILKVTEIDQ